MIVDTVSTSLSKLGLTVDIHAKNDDRFDTLLLTHIVPFLCGVNCRVGWIPQVSCSSVSKIVYWWLT